MAGNFQVVAVEFVNNHGADGVSYANEDGRIAFVHLLVPVGFFTLSCVEQILFWSVGLLTENK